MKHRPFAILGILIAFACAISPSHAQDVPTVAAAADLQFALADVREAFRKETGREVKMTFGSSGNFFRKIQQGAPFQVYFSADEKFVFDLASAGFLLDQGHLYAIGRIVILTPTGSTLKPDGTLADLKAGLADGRVKKFAIANPEHAPYGRRAEEALQHVGLWDVIRSKLVLGENVSQAAQFATSGGAQGGIVAYSLVLAANVAKLGSYELIPETFHTPLRQRMGLVKGAGDTARRFYDFVQGPSARAIMRRYGFVLPGEPL